LNIFYNIMFISRPRLCLTFDESITSFSPIDDYYSILKKSSNDCSSNDKSVTSKKFHSMVVNPGRSRRDPGGAERCLTGTGRVGAEQLGFPAATAWFPVERSRAGRGSISRVRTGILSSWVLKGFLEFH
jgi:hypothetical protein